MKQAQGIWSAVWLFIVLNENVYIMVTVPIWLALLGATILFLAFTIYRILKNCNQYLEVSFDEIELNGLTKEFGDFTAVKHINLTMTNV